VDWDVWCGKKNSDGKGWMWVINWNE
jgi:hypothetical protein